MVIENTNYSVEELPGIQDGRLGLVGPSSLSLNTYPTRLCTRSIECKGRRALDYALLSALLCNSRHKGGRLKDSQ